MNTLQKSIQLLSPDERRRALIVLILIVGMALLETASVASIMPFLAVLGSPEMIKSNKLLNSLFGQLGIFGVRTTDSFILILGVGAFALILVSAIYRTLTQYYMNMFIEMLRHSIGMRLLNRYLQQPYCFFLTRHSGDMSKAILSEVDELVLHVYRPVFNMAAYSLVLIVMSVLLVLINPWVALLTAGLLGLLNALFFILLRKKIALIGENIVDANKERFISASEIFGGIKDIKLMGSEEAYLSRFNKPSVHFAAGHATHQTLNQVPYYLIEAIAIGGMLLVSIMLLNNAGGMHNNALGEILPTLGLYAFAAYRLKPAVTNIFQGFTGLRFGRATVETVYGEMFSNNKPQLFLQDSTAQINPRHTIALEDLTYHYPGTSKEALKALNLIIPVGSTVGLVGTSGAGKTTLVDIVLGLLRPSQGSIVVDGMPITDINLRDWQRSLGYVSQEIFLTDTTIIENIALAVPTNDINLDQVVKCARMAQLDEFIVNELPAQYATRIGERGVRLSGGQRQRIGIARALYHNPSILIFDEATSALDNLTEKAVMDSIEALAHHKTIFLIAHRLSTVKNCDQIVLLDKGEIKAKGTFEELSKGSDEFRAMAGKQLVG